jgi:hypothetical protein
MPPPVPERYGNRRDWQLVEFDGAKVAHAIRLRDGGIDAASPLGSQKRQDLLAGCCYIDINISLSLMKYIAKLTAAKGVAVSVLQEPLSGIRFVQAYCVAGEVHDNHD